MLAFCSAERGGSRRLPASKQGPTLGFGLGRAARTPNVHRGSRDAQLPQLDGAASVALRARSADRWSL